MSSELLKDLIRIELTNKLQIWHRRLPDTDSVSLRLVIMVGSAHQNLKELGLAHFVEHIVFNFRNENNSIKQICEEIRQNGGYLNAQTSYGCTLFIADIPNTMIGKCLELIAKCLLNPDFSEKTINNERGIILNELVNDTNEFWYRIYRNILGSHSITYSGIGTAKTIKKINKDKIESFFKKHYILNKMVLICIGNVDLENIRVQLTSKWSGLSYNEEEKEKYLCPKYKKGFFNVYDPMAVNSFIYGYRVCGYLNSIKDYYALWVIRDYLQNILFDFVREEGILYEVGVYYSSYNFTGLLYIYSRNIKRGRRILLKKIKTEISKLKNKPFDQDMFKKYKDFTINQFSNFLKDRKELANYYAFFAESQKDKVDLEEPLNILQSLTPLDIKQVSNSYFTRKNGFVVTGSIFDKITPVLWFFAFVFILGRIFINYVNSYSAFVLKVLPYITIFLLIAVFWLIIDRVKLLRMIDKSENS